MKTYKTCLLLLLVALICAGCDNRGPAERAIDDEASKVENNPNLTREQKDDKIVEGENLKPLAKIADEGWANMSPASRRQSERMMRRGDNASNQSQPQKRTQYIRCPRCGGTGWVSGEGTCKLCDGTGKVPQ